MNKLSSVSEPSDPKAVQQVQKLAGSDRLGVVESWRTPGGRSLNMAGQTWRLVSSAALRLPLAPQDERFSALKPAAAGTPCAQLALGWVPERDFRLQMLDSGAHCFAITRGNPGGGEAAAADGAPASAREQVLVAVYERPDADTLQRLADNPPAPLASLSQFARLDKTDNTWLVGVKGDFAGWLAVRGKDLAGTERLLGAPWSTCALWRLGRQLQPAEAATPRQCLNR